MKKSTLGTKVINLALSIILAVGLMPSLAWADDGNDLSGEAGSFADCEFSFDDLNDYEVQGDGSLLICYKDQPANLTPFIMDGDWNALEEGVDYTYAVDGPTVFDLDKDLTGTVTVTGMGVYAGETKTITYTLASKWSLINGFVMSASQCTALTDGTVDLASCLEFYDFSAKLLTCGADYVVTAIYCNDDSQVDSITEKGTYRIAIEGRGSYTGSTTLYLFVYEQGDLRAYNCIEVHGAYVDSEGVSHLPEYQVVLPTGEMVATTLSDFRTVEGGYSDGSDLKIGSIYSASCSSADPNYTGSWGLAFIVYAQNDLNAGSITVDGDAIECTGSAIDTSVIVVKDALGNVVDPSEYTLTFMVRDNVSTDIPTQCGRVYICAAANEGSAYKRSTYWKPFRVVAPALTEVEVPVAKTGLVYNGKSQTGVAAAEGYTVEGGSATDAGSYTATATLAEGYVWSDGTTEPKQISWSIAAAAQTISVAKVASATNYNGTLSRTVNAIKGASAKGALSYSKASVSCTSGATGSFSGYFSLVPSADGAICQIKVAPKTPVGTYAVTIRVKAAATDKYEAASKDVVVTVKVTRFTPTISITGKVVRAVNYSKTKDRTVACPLTKIQCASKPMTYELSSAKNAAGTKVTFRFSVDAATGAVTVKAGTLKGTYTVNIKVKSTENENYKGNYKIVPCTVKVV